MTTDIIIIMSVLGYPTDYEGVCHGLAIMAERARQQGQYERFKQRMDLIEGVSREVLDDLWRLKFHPKESKVLNEREKMLLSLDAFCFQVWAHFNPSAIQKFLEIKGPHIFQSHSSKLEKLLLEEFILPEPRVFYLNTEPKSTGENDKKQCLTRFLQTIEDSVVSCGLVLGTSNHTCHVFYDRTKTRWFLTNHSVLTEYNSIEDLLNPLIDAFTTNHILNCSIDVYADESPKKQELLDDLETIAKNLVETTYQQDHLNPIDSSDTSLLWIAAQCGNLELVQSLIKYLGVDAANQKNDKKISPLWIASQNGHLKVVKALLKLPKLDPIHVDKDGTSALRIAALCGHVDIVQALLKAPVINNTIQEIDLALLAAAANGHSEVVKLLLEQPGIHVNYVQNQEPTALWRAAEKGQTEVIKLLLNRPDIDVNAKASKGVFKGVGANAKIYAVDATPLWVAVENGHLKAVKALLKHQAIKVNQAPNDSVQTPLYQAAKNGRAKIVNALLRHPQVLVHQTRHNPLRIAAKSYRLNVIKVFFKHSRVSEEDLKWLEAKARKGINKGINGRSSVDRLIFAKKLSVFLQNRVKLSEEQANRLQTSSGKELKGHENVKVSSKRASFFVDTKPKKQGSRQPKRMRESMEVKESANQNEQAKRTHEGQEISTRPPKRR